MITGTRQGWRGENKALQPVGAMEGLWVERIEGLEGINPATPSATQKSKCCLIVRFLSDLRHLLGVDNLTLGIDHDNGPGKQT